MSAAANFGIEPKAPSDTEPRLQRSGPARQISGRRLFLALTLPNPRYNEGRRPFRLHVAER
jgi:hypothetical protein